MPETTEPWEDTDEQHYITQLMSGTTASWVNALQLALNDAP